VEKSSAAASTRRLQADLHDAHELENAVDALRVGYERVAFGVLGDVAAAVSALDHADLARGVNVTLDAEVAAAVKTLVTDFKTELQTGPAENDPGREGSLNAAREDGGRPSPAALRFRRIHGRSNHLPLTLPEQPRLC
jgi:hypothetical protein